MVQNTNAKEICLHFDGFLQLLHVVWTDLYSGACTQFWTLATFPVRFCVLSRWTYRNNRRAEWYSVVWKKCCILK